MISLMNLTSKNVVSVTIEQNLLERLWALKCQVWSLVIGEPPFEVKY
ncbi:hypothetical protein G112A_00032 [Candidatus Nanosynsacchari sp. TM7_G1_3_12Alb]|nr:hypothetical protein G112A_00032 [Candidatus Nanosynsacchari sp. TM7_G1_3_12Alb]